MNHSSKLPIPSFRCLISDRLEVSPYSTDLDEDDTLSLLTQYEEGMDDDLAEYGTQAKVPPVASMNTMTVPKKASESSKRIGRLTLVEASPVHQGRNTTQSNESSIDDEAKIPLLNFRRVTRSSTRLIRAAPSILTEIESRDETPPPSLPDAPRVVAVSPPRGGSDRSICRASASDGADSRKRSAGSGSTASKKKKRKTKSTLRETTDFEAKTAEIFNIPVHTLILGNHPSHTALKLNEYYGHKMSAFWWIAGDCFGFRRAEAVTRTGAPLNFAGDLRRGLRILPYEIQVQRLCCRGFALWNILHKCKRRGGSSDRNIESGVPNDIRKWCQDRPSIRRIVFSHGKSTFHKFAEHFQDWLESGELVPSPHKASEEAFEKYNIDPDATPDRTIECVVAIAVSGAETTYNYAQKRDFWKTAVFDPGMQDFEEWEEQALARGNR